MKARYVGCLVLGLGLLVGGVAAQEKTPLSMGSYSSTIKGDKYTITFAGKAKGNTVVGTFTIRLGDEVLVEGTYKGTRGIVEFTDVKGDHADKGAKVG